MTTVRRKLSSELMILLIKDKKLSKCCEDPVIHERINDDMYAWVEEKAPGVRNSTGCPKKSLDYEPSLRMILHCPL